MKTIEISTATKPLSEYAEELGDEMIVLTAHQKPVAAIVSLKNVDRESLSLSTNPEFVKIIDQARGEFRAGRKLSLEEMKDTVVHDSEEKQKRRYPLSGKLTRYTDPSGSVAEDDWEAMKDEKSFDVTQDPIYQMEGYDSGSPADLSVNLDKYLYGKEKPE